MSIFKDVKIICLIVTIATFTIGYFIGVNRISYAFTENYNPEKTYQTKMEVIEKCAQKYGELNKALFEDNEIIYIKVSDLITANLIAVDHDGMVKDSLTGKSLNDKVIKIKYENDKYSVEVSV